MGPATVTPPADAVGLRLPLPRAFFLLQNITSSKGPTVQQFNGSSNGRGVIFVPDYDLGGLTVLDCNAVAPPLLHTYTTNYTPSTTRNEYKFLQDRLSRHGHATCNGDIWIMHGPCLRIMLHEWYSLGCRHIMEPCHLRACGMVLMADSPSASGPGLATTWRGWVALSCHVHICDCLPSISLPIVPISHLLALRQCLCCISYVIMV